MAFFLALLSFCFVIASSFAYKIESARIRELEGKDFLVFFPFGSNEKNNDPAFDQKLAEAAAYLKESKRNVVLTGHSDAVGDAEKNRNLAWDRAKQIKRDLVNLGVEENQIRTDTKGEDQLLNPDDPAAAENRRVEVHFPK